jgi:2-polyprenyl-3-methyl-5-hydroxy-6-metoxy-1,4-benzoquinol methylase
MLPEIEATVAAYPTDVASAVLVLSDVVRGERAGDETYFRNQLGRYTRTVSRIREIRPEPCRVLDIGSHYLHQSALLSSMGYDVYGIDVDVFADAAFVVRRASQFGVHNSTVNALENGQFLTGMDGKFDVIVFTEILEHITFNPVRFWRRVYELLTPNGMVYLSTPNAMRPAAVLRQFANLARLRGIGISLDEIMGNVTYGHHWKEYSAWEIRKYFTMLSADFVVHTNWYSSDLQGSGGPKAWLKKIASTVPWWRSDVEALVTRNGNAGFTRTSPQLRMHGPAAALPNGASH